MTLSKEKSKFNGAVDATFTGFAPGSTVTLLWPGGTVMATAAVDSSGTARTRFRTPLVALGTYRVEARDGTGRAAWDSLGVIPRIMLNEESGPVTTRLRVYFYGFAPGERVEVRWYDARESAYGVLTTVTIAGNGRGSSLITIPRSTGLGERKVMGRVVGVARSASTTFTVTAPLGGASAETPTGTPTAVSTPTPEPTATPVPDATAIAEPTATPGLTPVATPTPEPTLAPTLTPVPDPTETPVPTEAPAPTAMPEPTVAAEPTATPGPPVDPSADE